jgi:hypothetical protein
MTDPGLLAAQEALVRAITAGGPLPPGFDEGDVHAAALSILRKRAGEVARSWPALAESYGSDWSDTFVAWAADRPTQGSIRDAWDFARAHSAELDPAASRELLFTEMRWHYDGKSEPRPRRFAVRLIRRGIAVQLRGRVRAVSL